MDKPFGFVKQPLNYSKIEIQGVKCKGCKGCSSCKNNTQEKCSIM